MYLIYTQSSMNDTHDIYLNFWVRWDEIRIYLFLSVVETEWTRIHWFQAVDVMIKKLETLPSSCRRCNEITLETLTSSCRCDEIKLGTLTSSCTCDEIKLETLTSNCRCDDINLETLTSNCRCDEIKLETLTSNCRCDEKKLETLTSN
jgi:hypothetical protein